MSPVDTQVIQRKIEMILSDLSLLEEVVTLDVKEYLDNYELQLQAERLIEKVIGRVVDINYHILKHKSETLPKDYTQSFQMMGELGIVDKDLVVEISPSAGLRNVLAHEYDAIDSELVYDSVRKMIRLIPNYLKKVEKSLTDSY